MKIFFLIAAQILLTAAAFSTETKSSSQLVSKIYLSAKIGGAKINYEAETGYLELKDDKLKHIADVFYVSYRKKGEKSSQRPISFCFNGGPGSSAIWLHLGALGPKRMAATPDGIATRPPYLLVENEHSWLDVTDLVFIDPVGTGFSRPAEGEDSKQFYGYANDIKAVSEFIRQFLNKHKRWDSPLYLVGESYGTTRAVGVSKYLIEEHGIHPSGISLISAALDFRSLREFQGNNLPSVCNLPVYAATAAYHNKIDVSPDSLPQFLRKVENFAINHYKPALSKGRTLPEAERLSIADSLVKYTAMNKDFILRNHLRIPSSRFRKQLLADEWLNVGRFDSRLTIADTDPEAHFGRDDPSYVHIKGGFGTCMNHYVRTELAYENDLPYKIIGNVSPWDFADGRYLNVIPELERAMLQNPAMKVWVASGYYDMATSYFGTEYALAQLTLPDTIYKQIYITYYYGGHMMYLLYDELVRLKKDAVGFYKK
jgi:carboxypeptidase C (cathepsin A)